MTEGMSDVNATFFDVHGKRIFSIETPEGFVHLCDDRQFDHVSDALRYVKSLRSEDDEKITLTYDVAAPTWEGQFTTVTDPVEVQDEPKE